MSTSKNPDTPEEGLSAEKLEEMARPEKAATTDVYYIETRDSRRGIIEVDPALNRIVSGDFIWPSGDTTPIQFLEVERVFESEQYWNFIQIHTQVNPRNPA